MVTLPKSDCQICHFVGIFSWFGMPKNVSPPAQKDYARHATLLPAIEFLQASGTAFRSKSQQGVFPLHPFHPGTVQDCEPTSPAMMAISNAAFGFAPKTRGELCAYSEIHLPKMFSPLGRRNAESLFELLT